MINSTKAQLEEFKKSLIWKDICTELDELARLATLEYSIVGEPHTDDSGHKIIPNTSETLIHLGDIKGRLKAAEHFRSIIDSLITGVEMQEDEKDN